MKYEALVGAGRTWEASERVTLHRRERAGLVLLDDPGGHDYNAPHYATQLLSGYASRLRKAFSLEDYETVCAQTAQPGLFS